MTTEIERGGFSDSLSYLVFGDGTLETFEPFCEASLIEPYDHKSLETKRMALDAPDRIQLTAGRVENALHSIWDIDGVVSVKGWSEEVVGANHSIWSKRKIVSQMAYWTGAIGTVGSALYGLIAGNLGQALIKMGGDQVAKQLVTAHFNAAIASLGTPAGIGLLTLFIGGAVIWYVSSNRWTEASAHIEASERPVCHDVADRRAEILLGDLYQGVKHRGVFGTVSKEGIVAPQETQLLWIEAIRHAQNAFDNPLMQTGGELVSYFGRKNPFDVMDGALLKEGESGYLLMPYVEGAKSSYLSLATQVRAVQGTYDQRGAEISRNAERNREIIQKRYRAAYNVVDSIYWTRVDAAKKERDRALAPYVRDISHLPIEEMQRFQADFDSNPRVKQAKAKYRDKVRGYDDYRALAHAGIDGWFRPQLKREHEKEKTDLKANHQASLSHLSLFYPSIRDLYRWTTTAIDTYEEACRYATPPSYEEAMRGLGAQPAFTSIVPPVMPQMQTAVLPEEPTSSTMRSWADAGSGLGLDFFLTCAGIGAGFYAAYERDQDSYDEILTSHRTSSSEDEFRLPGYQSPPAYNPPVVPSAPRFEDVVAPPAYEPPAYAPPVYEQPPAYNPSVLPSAPRFEDVVAPPSYEEATRYDHPVPSAPPLPVKA